MNKIRNKYFLAGFTVIVVLIGLFVIAPTFLVSGATSPGENLLIGDEGMASFVDKNSGVEYSFRLIASEWDNTGEGQVTLYLEGPILTLCTAQGDKARINFDDPPDYIGNAPLTLINCGTAYGMAVSIDGCQGDIEFHGYEHSDYPLVTYMGMMTTDVKIKIGTDSEANEIEFKIYTPKEEIELEGDFSGYVEMDTCP